jgi:hypothetical protein
MPGETIGNSRCQCIMPFKKHKALEKVIERQEKEITKVQERAEEIRKNELVECDINGIN